MRRVVITGVGMVTPLAANRHETWSKTLNGKTGVARIERFPTDNLTVHIAAEVKPFEMTGALDPKEAGRASRFVRFAAKAAREAIEDAGLTDLQEPFADRVGCVIGVGLGALEDIEENTMNLRDKGQRRVSPFFIPYTIPNMAAGVVANFNNLRGPNMCTTTACTSGTHAIGEAFFYIRNNIADAVVCGGAEGAISPLGIAAFAVMKALSSNNDNPELASRPFDKDRDGFVIGEGAGMLVLEELESAKQRGAAIYAEVVGYGMSGDAYHITAPPENGEGAQRCMRAAIQFGEVPMDQIDYINAHGTSTPLNDRAESRAIMGVLGDRAHNISISSTKGATGHCLGAAGGIEAAFTALALKEKVLPPTANYRTRDPQCPLDYTPVAREMKARYALSNSFGFGGTNGCLAFKAFS